MPWLIAAAFLFGLVLAPEVDAPYDRQAQYGHWADIDGDCQNTRQEVLVSESLIPVTLSSDGCTVLHGVWYDPYTAQTFTRARDLDVDHVVPLAEAHDSGAYQWTDEKRRAYANDLHNPGHLIAVEAGANRRKRAKDPADWLPPNEAYHCAYVLTWIGIKQKWRLTIDEREAAAIGKVLGKC